jgi:hypothetical protein
MPPTLAASATAGADGKRTIMRFHGYSQEPEDDLIMTNEEPRMTQECRMSNA